MLNPKDLLVTPEIFAEIACLDGKIFGVTTSCENCSSEANVCLRRFLVEALLANQALVEATVGWQLTPRYHVEEITIDYRFKGVLQLSSPGIAALNVKPKEINIGSFPVRFYLLDGLPVQQQDGVCFVELDKNYIDNPNYAVVRDSETQQVYKQIKIGGFPRQNAAGNWEVALDVTCSSFKTVSVHHCKYAAVLVPTLSCSGTVCAKVNNQHIPFAKPPTQIPGGTVYWFYLWSLVTPAFQNDPEPIDLAGTPPQFYKLANSVQLLCLTDEPQLPAASFEGCADKVELELLDAQRAFVRFKNKCAYPTRMTVWYRTDPALVGNYALSSLMSLKEAIAYLTASELPLDTCGCSMKQGFIFVAQSSYSDIRFSIQGEKIANIRYGNKHGQLIFHDRLSKVYKFKRLVTL